MLLAAVTVLTFASPFLAAFALFEGGGVSFATLCIAVAASIAMTVMSLVLIPGWESHMQHLGSAVSNRRMFYVMPHVAALFCALSTSKLGWTLYRRVRYG